jgi:saccharopine dehydrogenase (NAD+, L-lysine forming)
VDTGAILIVGGYGVVGARIAAALAPDCPHRVILAGRSVERAQAAASALGHGTRGRAIDVAVPASIDAALFGVGAVVSCIDQPGRLLLHAAIERGLRYTDITPHLCELGRGAAYEQIDARARACGARVVLGTGIVPGISNVMVRSLAPMRSRPRSCSAHPM